MTLHGSMLGAINRLLSRGQIKGTLGRQVSPGVYQFQTGDDGRMYFTSEQGTVMTVINAKVATGLFPVVVGPTDDGNDYEVKGLQISKAWSQVGSQIGSIAIPQHTGSTTGPTPELVEARQLDRALVYQDPNNAAFLLTITAFNYKDASGTDQLYPGGTIDVTSYIPAGAGTWGWVKVGFDKTGVAPVAVAGTPVSVSVPLDAAALALIPFTGYVPFCGVMLTNGQTAAPVETDFMDCSVLKDTGGGGGSSSPLTTKGDVWGYDTTNDRIPVGSDNTVLTADSAQPLGLKWALVSLVNSVAGILGIGNGGTGADLSATGAAHSFLKQSSSGAVVTVGTIADADLPAIATAHMFTVSVPGTLTATTIAIRLTNNFGTTRTITGVYLACNTAPTGQAIIVDVLKNGTTIFTTSGHRPQIAASAFSGSSTSVDVPALANGDYLQFQVAQIGSTIAGSDLTVEVLTQ